MQLATINLPTVLAGGAYAKPPDSACCAATEHACAFVLESSGSGPLPSYGPTPGYLPTRWTQHLTPEAQHDAGLERAQQQAAQPAPVCRLTAKLSQASPSAFLLQLAPAPHPTRPPAGAPAKVSPWKTSSGERKPERSRSYG